MQTSHTTYQYSFKMNHKSGTGPIRTTCTINHRAHIICANGQDGRIMMTVIWTGNWQSPRISLPTSCVGRVWPPTWITRPRCPSSWSCSCRGSLTWSSQVRCKSNLGRSLETSDTGWRVNFVVNSMSSEMGI